MQKNFFLKRCLFCESKMREYYVEKQEFMKMDLEKMLNEKARKAEFSWYVSKKRADFDKFLEIIRNGCVGEENEK